MDSSGEKPELALAGWYPDPSGSGRSKWWDGTGWAEEEWDARTENPPVGLSRPVVGPQLPVYTPFIWVLVALPFVSFLFDALWAAGLDGGGDLTRDVLVSFSGLVFYAASVVMGYLDWQRLRRNGFVRPFHWAWGFLPVIYVIGRTIVLRQIAPGRGMAPVWLLLAGVLVGWIIEAA